MSRTLAIIPFIWILTLFSLPVNAQDWVKKFTSPNCQLRAEAVLPSGKNFFVSGWYYDTINPLVSGTFITKIDSMGNPLWTKQFLSSSNPFFGPSHGLIKSKDGNLIFLLYAGGSNAIMKTDTSGNFIWGRNFWNPYGTIVKLEETNDGDIILVGSNDHATTTSFTNGFILWLDSNGNRKKYYDFVSYYAWNSQLEISNIIKTTDGGAIAIGYIFKTNLWADIFLVKLDSLGDITWSKGIGDATSGELAFSIAETSDGYVYCGEKLGLLLGKIDKQGNPLWAKTYQNIKSGRPRIKVTNSGIEITTLASTDSVWNRYRFVLCNTDLSGNFISSSVLPDIYQTYGGTFATTGYGNDGGRIILNQKYENGFKLIKSGKLDVFQNCNSSLIPSGIVAHNFVSGIINCSTADTIPIYSFIAASSPYQVRSERACNCEPTHLTHNIKGCKDEILELAASDGSSHIWNTGQTDSSINVNQPNLYWVQNTSSCAFTDTFNVSYADPKAEFTINKNEFVITEPVQLTNSSLNAFSYEWDFGDGNTSNQLNPTHNWTIPGDYKITLKASDGACSDIYNLNLMIKGIVVPNVFTPNNDGTNDTFILTSEGVKELNCRILDRWGNKIYEFSDSKGWNGEGASEGTYFYIISALIDKQAPLVLKGAFTLLR